MNLRKKLEQKEFETLSPYAVKVIESKGRMFEEEKCPYRTDFMRDRDRVIHSKAFRRLMHKTQVFISPSSDHLRTRLTHTLEVSQIARTIARGLMLNEDLTEALALAHDLGHTPFGHTGEKALNDICPIGFHHAKQSLRVVDVLEKNGKLNLTYEVRDGILNHSGSSIAETLEGKVLKMADRIAYINHDIDDAVSSNVLNISDIPKEYSDILGNTHSSRINNMINDILINSSNINDIKMSDKVYNAMMGLRSFMFENVYLNPAAKKEEDKASKVIHSLYKYFIDNKEKLPEEYIRMLDYDKDYTIVCDYIAGMTDRYAINLFQDTFVPKSF